MDKQFKISIIETEYFTNVEKKTVTCKIYYMIKTSDDRKRYAINALNMFVDGGMCVDSVYHPNQRMNVKCLEQQQIYL